MKNWETAEFTNEFVNTMMCSGCPARTACARDDSTSCIHTFFAYAMKDVVKKMTMQEWANVTGMSVAKDENGTVFLYSSLQLKKDTCVWDTIEGDGDWINITDRVTDADEHDWNIPCYPEVEEK